MSIEYDLHPFVSRNRPVLLISKTPCLDISKIATFFETERKYTIINVQEKLFKIAESKPLNFYLEINTSIELFINTLQREILLTWYQSNGYVIHNFPIDLKNAKLFEQKVCKFAMLMCFDLTWDAYKSRRCLETIAKLKKEYKSFMAKLKAVSRYYGDRVFISTVQDPQQLNTKDLNDYLEKKFL